MSQRNQIIFLISIIVVGISILVHLLHRVFGFLDTYLLLRGITEITAPLQMLQNLFFILPLLFLAISAVLYYRDKSSKRLPLFLTLTLTFASISTIAGGDGLVEYHFSIFMVIAFITFFNSIKLVLISAIIFAVQHFGGYFFFPRLLCGTDDYYFSLLMIHAVYLILMSGAGVLLIHFKNRSTIQLEQQKEEQRQKANEVVEQLTRTAELVLESVRQLKEGSQESTKASQDIAGAITELASGAEVQLKHAEQSEKLIFTMSEGINEIVHRTKSVSQSSIDTVSGAIDGQDVIGKATVQMTSIFQAFKEMANVIDQLEDRSIKIGQIVTAITEISNQTNLLALNASIEAARAGEHGRGFAVVADEVRKLSAQTETSTKEINAIIQDIQKETSKAVELVSSNEKEVFSGREAIASAKTMFDQIVSATKGVETQLSEMLATAQEVVSHSQSVGSSVSDMTKITKKSQASSEDIASASQQQLASVEVLQSISSSLADLGEELNQLTSRMKEQD
ncbi:methyl-accepting chemotaxis protein [Bacillus sp. YZJH907-2]|uniref:Methyl-accepting chemotaxis protein n=2 Tax=Halalkalibacter suaedae TaxID=2822140 RepID=A0A941ASU0_9BACI|nr:methyl-accepting chemotaxis protein [Bacillus suaedae]MBP3949934.1 methyl-accepting chemotaxis protein [Bacillus suaedae]